jgi:hypothetical protein
MDELKVKKLMERYFEGNTSLDEERNLQCYFASGQVAESLKKYIPLFAFYAKEKQIMPPAKQSGVIRTIGWIATGIAASIAFLVILRTSQPEYVYLVDGIRIYDQQTALATADSKLQLLAASVQKAKAGMSAFDKAQEAGQSMEQWNKIPDAFRQIDQTLSTIQRTE